MMGILHILGRWRPGWPGRAKARPFLGPRGQMYDKCAEVAGLSARTWERVGSVRRRGPGGGRPSGPVALLVLLARPAPAGVVSADLRGAADRLPYTTVASDGGRRGCHPSADGRARDGGGHRVRPIAGDVGTALLHAAHWRRRRLHHGDTEDRVRHVVADRRLELVEHPVRLDLEFVQRFALAVCPQPDAAAQVVNGGQVL